MIWVISEMDLPVSPGIEPVTCSEGKRLLIQIHGTVTLPSSGLHSQLCRLHNHHVPSDISKLSIDSKVSNMEMNIDVSFSSMQCTEFQPECRAKFDDV